MAGNKHADLNNWLMTSYGTQRDIPDFAFRNWNTGAPVTDKQHRDRHVPESQWPQWREECDCELVENRTHFPRITRSPRASSVEDKKRRGVPAMNLVKEQQKADRKRGRSVPKKDAGLISKPFENPFTDYHSGNHNKRRCLLPEAFCYYIARMLIRPSGQ